MSKKTKVENAVNRISGSVVVRLSDASMKQKVADFNQRVVADPSFARSVLRDAGIVTAGGRLTARFK